MTIFQEYKTLLKSGFDSSPGAIFIDRLLKWLLSFNQKSGRFDASMDIELGSHDHPFHHYISCISGCPLWAEGQGLVADLLNSLDQPVIQSEIVETERGIRFYIVIITIVRVSWHPEVVNKAYAFGISECGLRFFAGERTFVDPLIWGNNLAYRHFLRFMG